MDSLLDARGLPIHPSGQPSQSGGSKRCACGVTISKNAEMCFLCTRKRQDIHESAIVAKLSEMSETERDKRLAVLPKGQQTALRMRIDEYLDDRAARFKPGRG